MWAETAENSPHHRNYSSAESNWSLHFQFKSHMGRAGAISIDTDDDGDANDDHGDDNDNGS